MKLLEKLMVETTVNMKEYEKAKKMVSEQGLW